ncbi:MAG TPA: YdcF family protein [Gaiellaceae bacterium]|jgi:uncharacterized SAM-binding protein YcdF (DUF218 family)
MTTAIVVLGHGRLDRDGEYRISERCRRLVEEAEALARSDEARVVVFTGWSPLGGRSEAEQMRDAWRGPDVELVVESTAATTAENAVRTLPLLRERGVDHAVVVCAPQHLARARYFFGRLYRDRGVTTSFCAAAVRPSVRAGLWELGANAVRRFELRAARAELTRRGDRR